MNWSPSRWALACLLSCSLLAVAFLPAEVDQDDSLHFSALFSPRFVRESNVRSRYNVTWQHAHLLARNYKAAQDVETANRVLGAHHETAAKPVVYFAPDIPGPVRSQVQRYIDAETAARGDWTGHGAVGILVVSDTTTTIAGTKLPTFFDRDRPLTTAVLPPTPENANHCVTVIRLRHYVFAQPPSQWSTDRLLLDGCAFTDAFGAPGPQISAFLQNSRYKFARRLSYAPGDTARRQPWYWYDNGDDQSRRCRGGIDSACVAMAMNAPRDDGWYGWRSDLSVRAPDESEDLFGEVGGFRQTFMESLARDLGSARFQRMWRSQKPLTEAYFEETGEPLATWIRAQQTLWNGPYRVGPMQPPASAFLTILTIVALAVITFRFAPRPYKI